MGAGPASDAERAERLGERLASFAGRCLDLLEALPRGRVGVANFRDQLARSATSVAANYAEACAPESRRDFASRMAKALKEAKESRMWLFLISRRGFFAEGRTKPLSTRRTRSSGYSARASRRRAGGWRRSPARQTRWTRMDNDAQRWTTLNNSPAAT